MVIPVRKIDADIQFSNELRVIIGADEGRRPAQDEQNPSVRR